MKKLFTLILLFCISLSSLFSAEKEIKSKINIFPSDISKCPIGSMEIQSVQTSLTWTYQVTDTSHTVTIIQEAMIYFGGGQISTGDYVGAFHDSAGVMTCCGYIQYTAGQSNILTVYGDGSVENGFSDGEAFSFKAWRASDGAIFDLITVEFSNPNSGFFENNGLTNIISMTDQLLSWPFQVTGTNHTIFIFPESNVYFDGNSAQTGDYVGVFYDSAGVLACAGYTHYSTSTASVIAAMGKDATPKNGFNPGEALNFKVWRASDGAVFDLTTVEYVLGGIFPNGGNFVGNGMTGIITLADQAVQTVSFTGLATTYCESDPVATLVGSPAGGTFSGNGVVGNTFNPALAGPNPLGTYVVYEYTPPSGYPNSVVVKTTVYANPVVSFSGLESPLSVYGPAYTLTGNPAGGTFSGNGISGTSFTPGVAGLGTHQITYSYTNSGGCTSTETQTVVVSDIPYVTFSGLASEYCLNDAAVTLTGDPAGGTFSGPGISGNVFNPIAAGAGIHTITYSYTGTTGSNSNSQTVEVFALPTVNLGSDRVICEGGQTFLNAGSGFSSYQWNTGATSAFLVVTLAGNYSITVSNAYGCYNSDDINVSYYNFNLSITGLAPAYCLNATPAALTGSPGGGTFSGDGITGNLFSPSTAGLGSHNITYTYSQNNCTQMITENTTVYSSPTLSLNPTETICTGSLVTLDPGSFQTYLWSTGATTTTLDATSAGTYSVTISDATGCTGSGSVVVSELPLPTPDLGPDVTICVGQTQLLDAGSFNAYAWITGASTQTITVNTAGTYNVTVTDGNGCSNSDAIVVEYANLSVSISGLTSDYCIDDSPVTLTGSPLGGTFSGDGISGNTFSPALAGAGTATIEYSYTDGNNCTDIETVTTQVHGLPSLSLDPTAEYCAGSSVTLDAGFFQGYGWSTGASTQTISVSSPATYSVTVTDGNGCQNSGSVSVSENPLPNPALGSDITICEGTSTTLNPGSFTSYLWSTGAATSTITVSTANTYLVTVTDGNGCSNSDDVVVSIALNPTVSFTGLDANYCVDDPTVTLTGSPTPGSFSGPGISGNTFSPSGAGAGEKQIEYSHTDINGCTGIISHTTTVHALPVIDFGTTTSLCEGESLILNGGTFAGYLWNTSASSQTITVNAAGTYSLTVTDGNSCTNSASVAVTSNPNPVVDLGPDQDICEGTTTVLDAGLYASYLWTDLSTNQTLTVSAAGTYSVTVTDSNGCTGSDEIVITEISNAVLSFTGLDASYCLSDASSTLVPNISGGSFSGSGISGFTFDPNVAGVGTHTITYTYTDIATSCTGTTTQSTEVFGLPQIDFGTNTSFCQGGSLELNGGTFNTYLWNTAAATQTITVTTAGTYSLEVSDNNGCQNSASVTVNSYAPPVVELGPNQEICQGSSITLDAGTFSTYIWSDNSTDQTLTVSSGGIYSLFVIDANGCQGSDGIIIGMYPSPTVTLAADASVCNGDSYILDAGVQTAYAWSTSETTQTINVSTADTYSVTVTDGNGCQASDDFVLGIYPNPTVTLADDASVCSGNSYLLDAGVQSAYAWSTSETTQTINVSAAGAYSVTVTDGNGCQASDDFVLGIYPNPTVTLATDASICDGSSYMLDAGIQTAYAWSTSETTQTINVTAAGAYSVTVTDGNGCQASDDFVLGIYPNPTVTLAADASICDGGSYLLDAGVQTTYAWSTSETTQTINVSAAGTYSVTVTDGNSCQASDDFVLGIYPNPTVTLADDASICDGSSYLLDAGIQTVNLWSTYENTQTILVSTAGTYTVTVANVYGCQATDEFVLGIYPNPTVTLANDASVCDGSSYLLDAGIQTAYAWSTSETTQTINVDAAGTYSVTVTDGNSCQASDDFVLGIYPNPTVALAADASVCDGSSYMLDAGVQTAYAWSTSETTQTISVDAAGTYTVTVANVYGCQATDEFVLGIYPNPTVALAADASVCDGNSYMLDAGIQTAYAWSTLETTQTISVSSAGSYSVTVTDANGCQTSDDFVLGIYPNPTVGLAADASVCDGSSYLLDAGVQTAYAWSTSETTQTINVSAAGTYSVTVTDGNGCQASDEFVLGVYPLPTVTLAANASICDGSSYMLDAGVQTAYAWSTSETTQTISVDAAGTYSVTVTDGNGCQASDDFVLGIYPNPTVTLAADASVCEGNSYMLDAGVQTAYAWSTSETTQTISVDAAGTYSVTVTDGNGCQASDDFVLGIYPNPTVTLANDASVCDGSSYLLDAGVQTAYAWSTSETTQTINVSAAGTYSVTVTDGNGCLASDDFVLGIYPNPTVTLANDASVCDGNSYMLDAGVQTAYAWSTSESTQTINVSATGTYSVTVTDGNGCQASDEFVLGVYPLPTVTLAADASICDGSSYMLDAGVQTAYAWSTSETTQTISVDAAGTYSVTVTDLNSCQASDDFVLGIYPNPTVTLANDASVCDGSSYLLDAGVQTAYAWSTSETTQTINVSAAGTYSVTVTDGNGCQASDEFVLGVYPLPTVTLAADASVCDGSSYLLDAGVQTAYAWSTSETTQTINVSAAGTYSVTVTDGNGCQASDEFVLGIYPNPTVTLDADASVCNGDSYLLDAGVQTAYAWSTSETTQTISVYTAGTYSVTVTNGDGCEASDDFVLGIYPTPTPSLAPHYTITPGYSATLDAGPGFVSYLWNNTSTDQSIQAQYPGIYSVEVTDGNACINSSAALVEYNLDTIHYVTLVKGWSFFSTFVSPYNDSIPEVFAPVISSILMVKNSSGSAYWPFFGLNQIGDYVVGQGYQVNSIDTVVCPIPGTIVLPQNIGINVEAGWRIIGYLRHAPGNAADMVSSIYSNLLMMKNTMGQSLWPYFGLNQIGNMQPGQGYQTLLSAASTLTYPKNTAPTKASYVERPALYHFQMNQNTGSNMTLGIPLTAWEHLPNNGDEIAMLGKNGTLIGGSVFTGDHLAIPIWGDDVLTDETENIVEGENFTILIWDQTTDLESELIIQKWIEGDEFYARDKISIVGKIQNKLTPVSETTYSSCFPNPFRDELQISFTLPVEGKVIIKLIDMQGKVVDLLCSENYQAGNHQVNYINPNLAPGIYYYQLNFNDKVVVEKIVKE
ncbi:MAG: T9SS type A sorting domain-containing protein [Bacteroidales bacterium]|nr:T9SS type A sorting domain-containing protein [Bacteroidales bacterium]MCF8456643.1 T9SS type A sorting domain-containing protein [Bacteroidales bacterium]